MTNKKITEGDNEFCQVSTTSIVMKTKADLEKEKKNLEDQFEIATKQYDELLAELNNQLNVFTK